MTTERSTGYNSTFAIGGVSCSADSLELAESFVLRINFCSKIATFAKPENVSRQVRITTKQQYE
jgi:hypothetical protein